LNANYERETLPERHILDDNLCEGQQASCQRLIVGQIRPFRRQNTPDIRIQRPARRQVVAAGDNLAPKRPPENKNAGTGLSANSREIIQFALLKRLD